MENKLRIQKISLEIIIDTLNTIYEQGFDYVDFIMDVNPEENKPDTLGLETFKEYFSEDLKKEIEEEEDTEDALEETVEEVHPLTADIIKSLL